LHGDGGRRYENDNDLQIHPAGQPQGVFPKARHQQRASSQNRDKFLHDNPEMLDQNDTFLTIVAFSTAYPCK